MGQAGGNGLTQADIPALEQTARDMSISATEPIAAADLEQGTFPPSVVQTQIYGVITPNG